MTLLERAQREGTPLIDGKTVTFIWQGKEAPRLLADFNNWDAEQAAAMTEAEPQVWAYSQTLPRDAYIEYAYIMDPATSETNTGRAPDPFNPRTKWNGIKATNHYFYMPEAAPTPLTRRRRGLAKGTVTRHQVHARMLGAGKNRDVYLYRPPTSDPVPLLLVLDGVDYLRQAKLTAMVDNLIDQERIQPIALALVQNGRQARMLEYGCSDITTGFFYYCVLPLARQHLNLVDVAQSPGAYGVLGASMGGVMALYLGCRLPHIFGKVLSQSGGFSLNEQDLVIYDLVTNGEVRPIKIWMDIGLYDFLYPTSQRMRALLQERGYDVTYREYNGGHNYFAWRDDLPAGLALMFGPLREEE